MKSLENGPLAEKRQYNKSKRTKQKNKEEIGKRNQVTALRFQTEGDNPTSSASLGGRRGGGERGGRGKGRTTIETNDNNKLS